MICYMCQCIGHHPDGCLVGRAEKAEAKVAALEARLTELMPVVEAAEALCGTLRAWTLGTTGRYTDSVDPRRVVLETALLSARAKREATE